MAETTWSAALIVGASAAALTSKPSSSTVTPSAFSPSTSTMRTAVGAIDTPSTVSTSPPKLLGADLVGQCLIGLPQTMPIDLPDFVTTTIPTAGRGGYESISELR